MIEKDFGDWLSPILVKEIRQGFRSRVFTLAFLLIQGFMIFCVVIGLISAEGDFTDESGFFWTIIDVPLLLLMPCLGFGVLGSEIRSSTMELLFLTRLSAWRIVLGKWTAIVAQSVLIVCAVLPYMVLRYFIGGVNLLGDLEALGWVLYASALLTGLTIAISPYCRTMLSTVLMAIVSIVLVIVAMSWLQSPIIGHGAPGPIALIALVLGPLVLLMMFELAVTRIAPAAENHAFRKRLLGFLIIGAIGALYYFSGRTARILLPLGVILLLPVCIASLCEEIKPIPSIYLPFVKRGVLGQLAGMVFYPGWTSGLVFTILVYAGFIGIFYDGKQVIDEEGRLMLVSLAGALIMPLAVEKLFFGKLKKPAVVYFALQAFMFIAFLLARVLKDGPLSGWMSLVAPLPTSVLFLGTTNDIDNSDAHFFLLAVGVVLIGTLVVLAIKSIGARREIAAQEKIARETLMNPGTPELAHASAA